jgi:hypothetical protein
MKYVILAALALCAFGCNKKADDAGDADVTVDGAVDLASDVTAAAGDVTPTMAEDATPAG